MLFGADKAAPPAQGGSARIPRCAATHFPLIQVTPAGLRGHWNPPRFPVLVFLVQPHGCGSQARLGLIIPARDVTKLGVYGNTITLKSLRGFHRTCSSCQVMACRALKWNFLSFSSRVDMVCSIPFPIYRNSPFRGYKNRL